MQHAGDLGQAVASDPTPYHLTGSAWSILDLSAPQSGYAFAQTPPPDSTPPTFVSSKLNDVTGVLTITFSEAIDVTPTTNVVPTKIHIRDSGNYADSVTLTAGELGTAADAVTISFTLTDQHRVTVTGWATPELMIEPGAVQDTSGNLIASTFDVSTAAFVHSFNVSSQDTSPRGMAFSNNGAKMFVVGDQKNNINEYTLSTPFDVSTASHAHSFNVSSQDREPIGMAFSNNGAKMFVVGWVDIDIYEYTLRTPFKVSTALPAHSFDVFFQDFSPRGMAFSNDGAKMFVAGDQKNNINEYTLSTPFDVSTASFDNVVFSVSDQDKKPEGMAFSNDGAKMFVVGWNNNAINEYTLYTPFDISTASFVHSFNVSSQDTSPRGMALSNDGTKMFVVGDQKNNINEYTLSSVYPIRVTSLPAGAFVTIWKTTSTNEAITFPGRGTYTIDWGDGSSLSQNVENQQQHTYADAGNYMVSVSGDLSQIFNNCLPNAEKLISIEQWGDIRWSNMRHAFCGASQMTYDATDNPNLSSVSDMEGMFRDTSFNGDLYSWDVSSVTDMSRMFNEASHFNGDLSSWDVSSVTDMSHMFFYASSFNGDLSRWDVSSVTDMASMFDAASDFDGDLSGWDVSSVTDMSYMFASSHFNGDISRWDVSSVTDMSYMFFYAPDFDGDLSGWDVSSVTDMHSMFLVAFDFNGDLSEWDISSVNNMSYMFSYSSFDGDLSGWDVSGVAYMEQMFQSSSFNGNLGNWYITLDNASVTGILQAVGNITPQNEFLATHEPTYGIGSSSDSEHFGINGAALVLMTIPDANPAIVNITSTGDFGTSNSRIFEITVLSGVADTTSPRLASIERFNPTSQNTDSSYLVYKATFNESVTGVGASDFVLSLVGSSAGTGSITGISGSGSVYYVTVSAAQDGTYNLDLVSSGHGIRDAANNLLNNTAPTTGTDETYTVSITVTDNTNPRLASIERFNPTSQNTDSSSLDYKATFNESVTGVGASDFVLSSVGGNAGTGSITGISGSGSVYYVTVSAAQDGTYNLDLVSSGHGIRDAANNLLNNTAPTTGTDETYTVSITVTDNTNPRLASIERFNPTSQNTDSSSLDYKATFNESVTGVGASDFVLSSVGGNAGTGSITGISGSGSVYYVTVSAAQDGTYNLDLVSSGHGIRDAANNLLNNTTPTTGTDETYTVSITVTDNTNPRLASIERYNPASQNTDSQYLIYKATFDESVTGVDTSDFVLSSVGGNAGTGSITRISGSGSVYYVTVSAAQDGTYNLDLVSSDHGIEDIAENPLTNIVSTSGTDHTYTVNTVPADATAPTLASIERYNPAAENTDSQTLVYKVTFSENVTGVDTSDFTLSPGSTGTGSGQFTQTRTPAITIPYDQIVTDTILVTGSGTATSVSVAVDIVHQYIVDLKVDLIAPDGTVQTLHDRSSGPANIDQTYAPDFGSASIAGNWTLQMHDDYSADDGILNSWTLTANHDSDTATHVTSISGSGDVYYATLSAVQDGTYNLDLVSSGHNITDAAANSLTGTIPTSGTDHTYTVNTIPADTTAPTLASIERYNPAAENTDSQTLVYKVTFSENVTGVDTDDFVLSSGSTGNTTTTANSVTSISGSGSVYYATVSASTDGTYNLDLVSSGHNITDAAANPLTGTIPTTGTDHTYTVNTIPADATAPTLASIERYNPAAENTNSQTLVYKVTFSENVTGVDTTDFTLSPGSTGNGTGSGQFTQTRTPAITIPYDQIVTDTILVTGSGTATSVSVAVDIAHQYVVDLKVDLIAPDGTVQTLHDRPSGPANIDQTYAPDFGSVSIAGNWTLQMHDDYSADDGILNSWTLTVNHDSDTATHVTSISGSGDVYYATLSAVHDGTYNLDLVSSGHNITDAAANSLTGTIPTSGTDHTYTVSTIPADVTAPTLASIERYNPAAENIDSQTLVYKVTFSENVTGVDTDDFVLSSGSTGNTTTTANSVTSISGSGSVYYATVSASTDGTYNLDLVSSGHNITDAAANPLTGTIPTTGTDHTYTVNTIPADATAPTLASIERYNPAAENTDRQTLVYKVTFSENVTGVDTSDFTLSPGSTGTGSGQFTQTRTPAITIPYDQIVTDTILVTGSSTATSVSVAVDIVHPYIDDLKIDLIAPGGTVQTLHDHSIGPANINQTYAPDFGSASIAGNWTLQMHDDYSADDGILNSWTLTVNHDSDTATHVTSISGSGDVYYATLSAVHDGTYNLDLVSSGHNITDAAANSLTGTIPTSGTDHTYTVSTIPADVTAPTLASIERYSPAAENTDSQTLVYKVTFSENVTGVDTDDFVLSSGSTGNTTTTANSVTSISGSGSVYYATVSASTDGTYNLDLVSSGHNITDAAANPLTGTIPTTGTDHTYTVNTIPADATAPTLASIERYNPAAENTDRQTLVYKVTFSENVTGVDTSDFTLSPGSTGTGSGQFTQTRTPAITIPYDQIVTDTILVTGSSTATSVSVAVDIVHPYIDDLKIDLIAPGGTVQTLHDHSIGPANINQTYAPDFGSASIAGNWILQIYDRYSADDGILNSWTLTVNHDSDTATHVTSISGSGDVYYATLSAVHDGTYNLDLVSSGHNITDAAANSLTGTIPTSGTDHTYTVSTIPADVTAPTLASIERYSPAAENTDSQTLVYKVTFSENVTGVDTTDFTLSPDSMGGSVNNTSGQFTQTQSPSLAIPDMTTVSDTIAVPDSGTATSVSVSVDIAHTWIGDLLVELIAPDDTTRTLHNREGGGVDDIDQTYTPDFGDVSIAGTWTLRIYDGVNADPGVLNSWTLTVNHDSDAVTHATSISGSGDVYYVTISVAQEGTYNLDLVSSDHGITGAASNLLTDTIPTETDQTYTVSTAI